MTALETNNLRQLMAAYLHQDWWDEYGGSWESAVDDFVRRVSATKDEISALLASDMSDEALGETLDALGNFRDPGDEPDAHRSWLVHVGARLDRSSSGTNGS